MYILLTLRCNICFSLRLVQHAFKFPLNPTRSNTWSKSNHNDQNVVYSCCVVLSYDKVSVIF